jgi:hypothetical protein
MLRTALSLKVAFFLPFAGEGVNRVLHSAAIKPELILVMLLPLRRGRLGGGFKYKAMS